MNGAQLIELVLIEGDESGDKLFVLDWEYDLTNNKVLFLKLFPFNTWMKGLRSHPEYVAPRGNLILYIRDESGYISTSNRLTSLDENGKWYDEYGRPYAKAENNLSISELTLKLFNMDLLEQLDEKQIIKSMKAGGSSSPEDLNSDKPSA